MDDKTKPDWVNQIKARGWSGAMQTVLDVLEPVAPLASQFLWMVQPIAGLFNAEHMVHDLADALDSKEGVEELRQTFKDD